jgi:acetyl esterase/lipase
MERDIASLYHNDSNSNHQVEWQLAPSAGSEEAEGMTGPPRVLRYGPDPEQIVEWWSPRFDAGQEHRGAGGETIRGVVVLIHGGFWRARYSASLMHPLALDLTARGIAVWNIEYRRVGSNGGDPAVTTGDAATATDLLAEAASELLAGTSLPPVVIVGHSAGGHLAAWVGSRRDGAVIPRRIISQAGVLDLRAAADQRLGDGAVQDFLGGEPSEVPDRYVAAQPRIDASLLYAVHGAGDDTVPLAQSLNARDARGVAVSTSVVPAGHMDVIDPAHPAWDRQIELIEDVVSRP